MKRILALGLLATMATSCAPSPDPTSSSASPQPQPTSSPAQPADPAAGPAENVYISDAYGFDFPYPKGYYIDSPLPVESDDPNLLTTIEIWQQEDYEDIQERLNDATELPPNITIEVFDNSAGMPLVDWKQALSNADDRPITVDGQAAIAYTSTGLYEHDNVLVETPDGQYVLRLSVGYFDAESPMREAFQAIVENLTFR